MSKLSYFQPRLQELINTSFPELAQNQQFLKKRSELAAAAFEAAFLEDNDIDTCNAIANQVLFEGLDFSKFDTIFNIVCDEFNFQAPEEKLRDLAFTLLTHCEPVFAKYKVDYTFDDEAVYPLLYTELIGNIIIRASKSDID